VSLGALAGNGGALEAARFVETEGPGVGHGSGLVGSGVGA
jgi:hypothetical protein